MNKRIAEIRRNAGLSQEEFGSRLDVTQNYVWMIESGKRAPSERLLKSICREFGINESWLRTGEGEMAAVEEEALLEIARSRGLDKKQRALLLDIMNSPPEEIDAVINFMNRLSFYMERESAETEPAAEQRKIPPEAPPKSSREQEADEVAARIREEILNGGEKALESGTPPDGTGVA